MTPKGGDMEQPRLIAGSRLCLALTAEGLTVYGNPEALKSLAKWLEWIAHANPEEHYECHVGLFLEDEASRFEGKVPRNVSVLVERTLAPHIVQRKMVQIDGEPALQRGFDLTFMAVPEADLDQMAASQGMGILPLEDK